MTTRAALTQECEDLVRVAPGRCWRGGGGRHLQASLYQSNPLVKASWGRSHCPAQTFRGAREPVLGTGTESGRQAGRGPQPVRARPRFEHSTSQVTPASLVLSHDLEKLQGGCQETSEAPSSSGRGQGLGQNPSAGRQAAAVLPSCLHPSRGSCGEVPEPWPGSEAGKGRGLRGAQPGL